MSNILFVAVAFMLGAGEPAGAVAPGQLPPGHPPIDGSGAMAPGMAAPAAGHGEMDELLRSLDKAKDLLARDKSFEVATSIGKLYFTNRRYREAVDFLGQALDRAGPARTFFLEQRRKAAAAKTSLPTAEEAGCPTGGSASLEEQLQKARQQAKAGQAAAAARCARLALEPSLVAGEMRARALFLLADAKGAATEYTRVLEVDDAREDSLYGLGNVLLDSRSNEPAALKEAKGHFERLLATAPGSKRVEQVKSLVAWLDEAIAAGGVSRLVEQRAARKANPADKP